MPMPARSVGRGVAAWLVLVTVPSALLLVTEAAARRYTGRWAVLAPGGERQAARLATAHGCHLLTQVGSLSDYYEFECPRLLRRRSARHTRHLLRRLRRSSEILWLEQQYVKSRPKRDTGFFSSLFGSLFDEGTDTTSAGTKPTTPPEAGGRTTTAPWSTEATTSSRPNMRRTTTTPPWSRGPTTVSYAAASGGPAGVASAAGVRPAVPADLQWPDPLLHQQWYFEEGNMTMHVRSAWRRGYTGRGVAVSILDDGIQLNHPDLQDNYDPLASTDLNGADADPSPRDDGVGTNRHGTRNAGVVAAAAGNQHCGVGVAPHAGIGGVRMLDGDVTDVVEAAALSHSPQHVDIYSVSWGPEDDGRTVEGPGPLATRALIDGVLWGRNGKGSIFVWASGNGGRDEDDCNCDGYNGNIFTISISSTTESGGRPWYLERCASTLAVTYSSGSRQQRAVTTSDLDSLLRPERLCTSKHTGTSASAALAAGICALALQANPELSWRDMQHLIVRTADPAPLAAQPGWRVNAAGRNVSHTFGYGLMDAVAMVELAQRWTTAPEQLICITPPDTRPRSIPAARGASVSATMNATACRGTAEQAVHFLEHVQCRISVQYPRRGSLRLRLTSPAGTRSTLLFPRPRDADAHHGFRQWPFMSVHFWGEDPIGEWTLTVTSDGAEDAAAPGTLTQWQLAFFGTRQDPNRPRAAE